MPLKLIHQSRGDGAACARLASGARPSVDRYNLGLEIGYDLAMQTTRQVADLWGVRRDWVIEMARTGDLPAVQLEGRWFIHESVVEHYKKRPRHYRLQSATDSAIVGA